MAKKRILMALYGYIQFDGRVQCAAAALAECFDLSLISIHSDTPFTHPHYANITITIPRWARWGPLRYLFFVCALVHRTRQINADVVYMHDFFLPLAGRLVAKRLGAKFVYDAHELSTPTPGIAQTLRERLFYWMERAAIHHAELVIAANAPRAQEMRRHYRLSVEPLAIRNIPADEPAGNPSHKAQTYPGFSKRTNDEVWCVYQGDISLERGLAAFLGAFDQLDEQYRLLVVGGGPDLDELRRRAQASDQGRRIVFMGRIPQREIHTVIRHCEIGLMTYVGQTLNNVYCAPNKIFEYARAGLPCVAVGSDYLCRTIEEAGTGVAIETAQASAAGIAEAIRDVARQRENLRKQCEKFARENRWEHEADKLRRALLNCSGRPRLSRTAA